MIKERPTMPDLSNLRGSPVLPSMMLATYFVGDRDLGDAVAAQRRVFARLVDKAVREYEWGREAALNQFKERLRSPDEMATGRLIFLFTFVDHMENCINAVHRVCRAARILKGEVTAPLRDKVERRLVEAHDGDIAEVRNTVEHMHEEIQKDGVDGDVAIMIKPNEDVSTIEIGGELLRLQDLASVIRRMHRFAFALVQAPAPDAS